MCVCVCEGVCVCICLAQYTNGYMYMYRIAGYIRGCLNFVIFVVQFESRN